MKFLINRRTDIKQNCKKWGKIHRDIIIDILLHLNNLVHNQETNENFKQLQKSSKVLLPYRVSLGKMFFFKPLLESALRICLPIQSYLAWHGFKIPLDTVITIKKLWKNDFLNGFKIQKAFYWQKVSIL